MRKPKIVAACALLALAGCAAQTQTVARPEGLPDAPGLQAAPDEPGAWTYVAPGRAAR
ncbi:MAG TPA: lipoprotein [Geminicoccaceae bacterium]|nr:lipoprotein [Geminicoccaceae bacterium]